LLFSLYSPLEYVNDWYYDVCRYLWQGCHLCKPTHSLLESLNICAFAGIIARRLLKLTNYPDISIV